MREVSFDFERRSQLPKGRPYRESTRVITWCGHLLEHFFHPLHPKKLFTCKTTVCVGAPSSLKCAAGNGSKSWFWSKVPFEVEEGDYGALAWVLTEYEDVWGMVWWRSLHCMLTCLAWVCILFQLQTNLPGMTTFDSWGLQARLCTKIFLPPRRARVFHEHHDCSTHNAHKMIEIDLGMNATRLLDLFARRHAHCPPGAGHHRRKFRSQTSDSMDRWKAEQGRGREKIKIRRKKGRRERVRRKKMQMREKVGK